MASLHVLLTEAICILKQWFSLRSSSVVLLSNLLAGSSETRFTAISDYNQDDKNINARVG